MVLPMNAALMIYSFYLINNQVNGVRFISLNVMQLADTLFNHRYNPNQNTGFCFRFYSHAFVNKANRPDLPIYLLLPELGNFLIICFLP